MIGSSASYGGPAAETATIGFSLLQFDNTGALFEATNILKVLSRFRYLGIYHGDLLENFLKESGENFEPGDSDPDLILKSEDSYKGKFTIYR